MARESDLLREIKLQAGIEVGTLAVSAGPYPFEISVGTAMTRLISAHPRLRAQVSVADPREVLQNVLNELKSRGVTTFVIAHRPSVLQNVDRILVLKDGLIERFAPRNEVMGQYAGNIARAA